MSEEKIANIAQASFVAGAGLFIGYTLMESVLALIAGFLGL